MTSVSVSSSRPDATLKSLVVSTGQLSPRFNAARNLHYLYLPHGAGSVSVTPTATDAGATITVDGASVSSDQASPPVPLNVGRNVIRVEVTARDGTTKNAYTVRAIRAYPTLDWVRVRDNAPWVARDSAGELVFKGRMWLFGGYVPKLVSDVWSSADGLDWTKEGEIPADAGVNIPVAFVHDDRMWVTANDGKLFASADGAAWTLVMDQVPWKGRYAAGGAVFKGRIWVMGGKSKELFNDVWSSANGVRWDLETPHAPWSGRQLFSLAVHDDRLWAIGGGVTTYHPFRAYRDVWSSADGKTWTQAADEAPWSARIWNTTLTYKHRLWVLAGFRAEPSWNNFDDVWYSPDGADWRPLATETVWSPRHEVSAYVFDGSLWVAGGNAWPLQNDVWRLTIPGLTFLSQPVIEEFVGARYAYRPRADFNESRRKVRYRLREGPPWLTIDPDTGIIQGTPPKVEDVTVTIEAYDDAGETARQSYTLHMLPVT